MIPTPLLVFHFARAFGNAENLINLISKTIVWLANLRILYAPVNFVKAIWLP